MKNRKKTIAASLLCLSIFSMFLSGCGKKGDDTTAIAITPTPSNTTAAASETPTATPAASLNGTSATSTNTNGTSSPFAVSANTMTNAGISGNAADSGANKITGTIVAASMDDVTVRTSEGVEYTCSTANAVNNLNDGITLGNNITVTLSSMSAVNGLYTATELNEISSAQSNTNIGVDNTGNTVDDGTDSSGIYDNSQYSDGTYDNTVYDNTTYDDGTYTDYNSGYEDSGVYDNSGEEYYYYDPASEVYDDTTAY